MYTARLLTFGNPLNAKYIVVSSFLFLLPCVVADLVIDGSDVVHGDLDPLHREQALRQADPHGDGQEELGREEKPPPVQLPRHVVPPGDRGREGLRVPPLTTRNEQEGMDVILGNRFMLRDRSEQTRQSSQRQQESCTTTVNTHKHIYIYCGYIHTYGGPVPAT